MKITPAHDPNDFEVGERHNLARINVLNPDGTMNEKAGKYQGLDRFKCREEIVKDLKEKDLLIKIDEITHNVGHSERTHVMVEPYLSKQWFVKMRPLADKVLENQKNKETKVNFVPERYEKIMNHWMEITYDWCISRQLWWGHRIPAWYKDDEVYVGENPPMGEGWTQDEDVLDTWFSSALWPFSTLGWPNNTEDFERYYPNNVLITGYDIIPFWVNRMTFQGLHFTKKRPFKDCLIHGLIRDKDGRKMSKSLGNGVDPMDVIELYGADSLRFFLTTNTAPGMDLRYDEEKVKSTWNFINKLWNASRFVLMNIENIKSETQENLSIEDKWILTKLNKTIKNVRTSMEKYEFNNVGTEIYKFIWEDFCDNYIELSKMKLDNDRTKMVLKEVLENILKLLHPFMPYVTEEIYSMLEKESIMVSAYPKYNNQEVFNEEEKTLDKVIKDITNIRNLKVTNDINKEALVQITTKDNLEKLYKNSLKIQENKIINEKPENYEKYSYKSKYIDITFYQKGKEVNKELLMTEIKKLEESIAKRKNLLSNENYINKAPTKIVELDRQKLKEEEEKLKNLKKE